MRTAICCTFVVTLLALQACSPAPVTATARVHFDSATPEALAASVEILRKRFDDLRPSMRSSHTAKVAGAGIELVFRGDAPPDDTIRFLAGSRGSLKIHSPRQPYLPIATDRDVVSIAAREDELGTSLDFQLSVEAGERMLAYTSKNVGQIMAVSIDGEVLSRAAINGAFGARFLTSGLEKDLAMRVAGLVRHGRLPATVRRVDVRHPAR